MLYDIKFVDTAGQQWNCIVDAISDTEAMKKTQKNYKVATWNLVMPLLNTPLIQ